MLEALRTLKAGSGGGGGTVYGFPSYRRQVQQLHRIHFITALPFIAQNLEHRSVRVSLCNTPYVSLMDVQCCEWVIAGKEYRVFG